MSNPDAGGQLVLERHAVGDQSQIAGFGIIRSLVLCEPPLPVGAPAGGSWVADAEAAIARADCEEAALIGLREVVGYPPGQVDILRADPSWPVRSVLAPAWVREFRSVEALPLGTDRFALITTPTLLLLGSLHQPLDGRRRRGGLGPAATATALFRCVVWRCALRPSSLELEGPRRA